MTQKAWNGVAAAGGGIRFVLATPSVWPWALVPAAILLVLTCLLGALSVWSAGHASLALVGEPADAWHAALGWVVYLMLVVMGLSLAVMLALVLTEPLSGFALERIAREQEHALQGSDCADPRVPAGLLSVWSSLVGFALLFGVLGPLFVVSLLFPPAIVVTAPLKFLVGAWLLAWSLVDYPLSRRGIGIRARLRLIGRHFTAFTTFGLVWAALLIVPGLYLLMLPMGVAGAVRLIGLCERFEPR